MAVFALQDSLLRKIHLNIKTALSWMYGQPTDFLILFNLCVQGLLPAGSGFIELRSKLQSDTSRMKVLEEQLQVIFFHCLELR